MPLYSLHFVNDWAPPISDDRKTIVIATGKAVAPTGISCGTGEIRKGEPFGQTLREKGKESYAGGGNLQHLEADCSARGTRISTVSPFFRPISPWPIGLVVRIRPLSGFSWPGPINSNVSSSSTSRSSTFTLLPKAMVSFGSELVSTIAARRAGPTAR